MVEDSRAEYMKHYRKTPEGQRQTKAMQERKKAKDRAAKRLADTHPAEYSRYLAEELQRLKDGLQQNVQDNLNRRAD